MVASLQIVFCQKKKHPATNSKSAPLKIAIRKANSCFNHWFQRFQGYLSFQGEARIFGFVGLLSSSMMFFTNMMHSLRNGRDSKNQSYEHLWKKDLACLNVKIKCYKATSDWLIYTRGILVWHIYLPIRNSWLYIYIYTLYTIYIYII